MAFDTHYLYAADIDSVLFDQVSDMTVSPAIQKAILAADGDFYSTYVGVASQSPAITFATSGLTIALAKCGLLGFKIETGAEAIFFFQKGVAGGTRAGVSSHFKLTVEDGILVPRTLTAGNDGPAQLTYELLTISADGSTTPIALATSQSLAGSPAVTEIFFAGPVDINGVQLTGIQSINVDFGLTVAPITADGQVFPTYVGIVLIQPKITIRTVDALALNTFGISGVAQGVTDSIVYLRKGAAGGTRTADGTLEHISMTIDDGHISVNSLSGTQGDQAQSEVVIDPIFDGTNAPIVISTTAAIV